MKNIRPLKMVALYTFSAACTLNTPDPIAAENAPYADPSVGPGEGAAATPSSTVISEDPLAPAPIPAAGKAMLRVVHASADAPKVDVYAKGSATALVTGLAYGQTSSWIEVGAGTAEVELRASPSTATTPLVYTTGPLAIPDRANITAVAAGLLASANAGDAFRVIPLVNAFEASAPGNVRVRVLHAGSDAPSVGLDVGNDNPAAPEVAGLARFRDTGGAGIPLPAGKKLSVGIAAGGARVTSFTTPSLPEGANVLLIATGLLRLLPREGSGFALLAVGPNGNLGFIKQDPTLYTLHASPDAPEVDAFVGEGKIIDNLAFGKLTAPIQVPPGAYPIDVFAHTAGADRPGGAPVLSQTTPALEAGERYLTIATGFLKPKNNASQPLRITIARDEFALGDANARCRLVHASPDAPAVDVGLYAPQSSIIVPASISPVVFANVSFGNSSGGEGVSVVPATLALGVAPAGQDSNVLARFSVPAGASQRAFAVAAGALDAKGSNAKGFRLAVVDTAPTPWTVTHVFPH